MMETVFLAAKAAAVLAAILISAYSFAVLDLKKAAKFSAALGLFALSAAFYGVEALLGLDEESADIVKHLFIYTGMIFFYFFLSDCLSTHCPKLKEGK